MHLRLLLLSISLLLAACGGSGGSDAGTTSTTTTPAGALLVFDGNAASTSHVTARLAVIALERADGELTDNLLRREGVVMLADPIGASSGLQLERIPAGDYVAMHLQFVPDSAIETDADGAQRQCTIERPYDRLPIGAIRLSRGSAPWIVVGHASSLVIDERSRRLRHSFWARVDEPHIVRDLEVRVLAVDRDNKTAVGAIPVLGNLTVDLDFDSAERLVVGDMILSLDDFFAQLAPEAMLRIDALLVAWRALEVLEAVQLEDGGSNTLDKTEITATVVDTYPSAGAFGEILVRLQMVLRGGGDLPNTRPLDLTIRLDADTKVKLLPGRARFGDSLVDNRSRNGDFGDLAIGQKLKIRWRGALDGSTTTAERIDIVATGSGDRVYRWYEGRITALDAPNDRFEVELVGSTIRETVDASGAVIIGNTGAGLVILEVSDLALDDVVTTLGVRALDGSILAELIRRRL